MLEVSHSSCSMARSCPMKYKWRYVDGYKPIRKSTSLALGTVVHDAMDMFYSGMPENDISGYIIKTMNEQISSSSLTEQEDLQIIKHTALGMWEWFPYKNLTEFQEIKSEKEFKVPIGRKTLFVGKTDRIYKRDGKWWIG